jgi:hypothetical protein
VTTCLPSLSNDDIDACVYGLLGLGSRANGVHDNCAARFCARDQGGGVAPEEGDDRNALFEADREARFLRKIEI